MPYVRSGSNETPEQLLRRFRKVITRSGVLGEVRRRRWHVSKRERRRIEKKKAIRRMRRRERNRLQPLGSNNRDSRDRDDNNNRGGYRNNY